MGEIKYRVWDKENQEMYYMDDNTIRNNSIMDMVIVLDQLNPYALIGIYGEDEQKVVTDIELMQSTGLDDKNGTEIYRGDILKYTFDLPNSVHSTENGLKVRINPVFWSEWRSSFAVGNKMANNDLFHYVRNGNRVEVIGNIYENPELLEGVK